jgi:VWFA-related protein
MRQLAQETGGRSFFPSKLDDLNGVYAEIADELASQYTLGYSSKNAKRDGAYRRIVVQIDRPNVQPRTKRGYYAPTSR